MKKEGLGERFFKPECLNARNIIIKHNTQKIPNRFALEEEGK